MGVAEDMVRDDWSPLAAMESESPILFQEVAAVLAGKRSSLARELDKGVAPDRFVKGQALLAAYDSALCGLEKARNRRSS